MILLPSSRIARSLPTRAQRRRGAVALLILAILSVVLLLVVTFTTSSKLEQVAATNYMRTTQSRIAAATGLPAASPLIPRNRGLVWTGQSWNRISERRSGALDPNTPGSLSSQDMIERSVSGSTLQGPQAPRAKNPSSGGNMVMRDLAGSVNVNFVRTDAAFQRFIDGLTGAINEDRQTLNRNNSNTPRGSLLQLRQHLAQGPTPVTTAPIESLSQLVRDEVGGINAQTLPSLSAYLTVFSLSPEVFNRTDGTTIPKALWTPRSARDTLAALQNAFPDKSFRLLAQIAANLQDLTDGDHLPTLITDPSRPGIGQSVRGMGGSLFITEIYPDSETGAILGDAGQFVELWNGTDQAISLEGWSVGVASGLSATTPTQRIPLAGIVATNGFVILTDNYDSPSELAPSGTGSFVSVFGARADGFNRVAVQNAALDLPDKNGTVVLFDPEGRVADVFSYGDPGTANSRISFQRSNPRRPVLRTSEATPFRRSDDTSGDMNAWTARSLKPMNLNHPVILLALDTRWVDLGSDGLGKLAGSQRIQLGTSGPNDLDQSVLDVFSTPSPERLHTVQNGPAGGGVTRYAAGRLNLNTCHRAALLSLDDTINGQSILNLQSLERIESHRQNRLAQGQVPFRNATDILPLIFSELPPADRLNHVAVLLDQVAVGSASFEIVAEYVSGSKGVGRRASSSRQRWVVAYDMEFRRVVDYDPLY